MSEACREAREALAVAPAGAQAERVRLHRERCADCARFAASIEETAAPLRRIEAPLDQVARARIAARLAPAIDEIAARYGRPRRTARGWWIAPSVALAAAAALALWLRHRPEAAPEQTVVARLEAPPLTPFVVAGSGTTQVGVAARSLELAEGELVRATFGAARVTAIGPARVRVESNGAEARLALECGLLLVVDDHQAQPLSVRAPGATVRVRGTLFAVDARDGRLAEVMVRRGAVDVVPDGAPAIALAAIESWRGDGGPANPELARLLAEHDAVGAPPADAGTLVVRGDPAAAEVFAGAARLGPAPVSARAIGELELEVRAPGLKTQAIAAHVPADRVTEVRYALATEGADAERPPHHPAARREAPDAAGHLTRPAGPAAPAAPPEEETADALYARAEAALRGGETERGEALLEEVVRRFPSDALADAALYDLARRARSSGDDAAAARRLDQLTARGGGALREPAAWLRCRIDVDARRAGPASRCLDLFRRDFPESPHDAEALALIAGYADARAGCAAARPLYDRYLRAYPKGPFAAEAAARRARCAQ